MLLHAYIVPHAPISIKEIGKGEERKISKTIASYQRIARQIALEKPQTILIISPHAPSYVDYLHIADAPKEYGDFGMYHASEISFCETTDRKLVDKICAFAKQEQLPAGILGDQRAILDHGVMVPLYFIEQKYRDFQMVRIGVSDLSSDIHRKFGACIKKAIDALDRNVIVIASGDLSHKLKADGPYGYAKEGPVFDQEVVRILQEGDLDDFCIMSRDISRKSAQCGLPAFQMLSGILQDMAYQVELLSYEGVFGVGYACADISLRKKDPYTALAKQALETYIRDGIVLSESDIKEEALKELKSAVFVSLHVNGELRGCIGTIFPARSCVGMEIIHNAIHAGTRDPRFYPVRVQELDTLQYHVDVLTTPERISSGEELDVKRYGIIVRYGQRCGLLLPDLEGVNSVHEQIAIALRKGGIHEEDPYTMERFEVIRHYEYM